jgi:C1q domain-containing protein
MSVKLSALSPNASPALVDYIISNDVSASADVKVLLSSIATLLATNWATYSYNPYKFSVYRNASANTGSSGNALVTFDTVEYDTGSNYSVSTGKFTAPIAGFYHFSSLITATAASTQTFGTYLYKNGAQFKGGQQVVNGATSSVQLNSSWDLQLAANDYIQIYSFYGTSAIALAVGQGSVWFSGFLVSAT